MKQRLEWWLCKLRKSRSHQKQETTRRDFPRGFWRERGAALDFDFWPPKS
jgi:hypothetical protein